jgi:hypothetical protein
MADGQFYTQSSVPTTPAPAALMAILMETDHPLDALPAY